MLLITPMLVAQNTTVSLWEENLEQLSMDGEERNWEDELEELSRRLQEPININVATKRQLEEFPFLTAFQIEHLLAYVYVHGQMQTVYELQLVEGMDKRTIELLLPFICVKSVENKSGYPSLKRSEDLFRYRMCRRQRQHRNWISNRLLVDAIAGWVG